MKRKLIYISVSYILGLLMASVSVSPVKYALPLILSAFLVFFSLCKALDKNLKEIILMMLPFFIAFGVYRFYNFYVYETILKCEQGYFSGEITDITDYANDNSRYILDGTINNIIDAEIICYDTSYNCKIGDTMSFDCDFNPLESDYLFDSQSYYKPENIYLSADNITNPEISSNHNALIRNILYGYREKMILKFRLNMDKDTSAFLSAMVFGDKSDMTDSAKTMLYRSGIGHIMAISGIHVAICAGFVMLILKKLRLNKIISFGILCSLLSVMIIITESPMSVVRASIMLAIFYGSEFFRRENDTFNSLATAVLIICISNPFVIHNQGFLLSVSGTYGIGVLAPYMTKNTDSRIARDFLSMFYVSVCVIPLSIMYFDEVSIISPVTNIILIPLCSISLLIGLVFVMSGGLLNLLFIADYLIKFIMFLTELISKNSWIYISGDSKTLFFVVISLFITGISVYFIFRNRKLINIIIACGIVFMCGYKYAEYAENKDTLTLTLLGKNQNVSAVINCNGNTDIIDLSGHYQSPEYVKKYLSQNHICSVNNLLLTKNREALSASYQSALEFTDVKNIYKCSGDEIRIKYNDYTFSYNNGILTLISDGYSVCVSPYIYNGTADVFIFYGKAKNNSSLPEKFIAYNKSCNNFCISFPENSLRIRRL